MLLSCLTNAECAKACLDLILSKLFSKFHDIFLPLRLISGLMYNFSLRISISEFIQPCSFFISYRKKNTKKKG